MRFGWMFAAVLAASPLAAEELVVREVLQERDLAGVEDMIVIISKLTVKPGGRISLHTHAGDEHGVVIKGGTVELPNGKEAVFEDGSVVFFGAGQPHGGITNKSAHDMEVISTHVVRVTEPFSSPSE